MAIKIAGRDIDENWIDFGVRYPDGEILITEDEEDADCIIEAAMVVVPDCGYVKVQRAVFVTDWEPVDEDTSN